MALRLPLFVLLAGVLAAPAWAATERPRYACDDGMQFVPFQGGPRAWIEVPERRPGAPRPGPVAAPCGAGLVVAPAPVRHSGREE